MPSGSTKLPKHTYIPLVCETISLTKQYPHLSTPLYAPNYAGQTQPWLMLWLLNSMGPAENITTQTITPLTFHHPVYVINTLWPRIMLIQQQLLSDTLDQIAKKSNISAINSLKYLYLDMTENFQWNLNKSWPWLTLIGPQPVNVNQGLYYSPDDWVRRSQSVNITLSTLSIIHTRIYQHWHHLKCPHHNHVPMKLPVTMPRFIFRYFTYLWLPTN